MSADPDLYKGLRVLVTGGRGFIGSGVSRALEALGARVFTVGRSSPRQDQHGTSHVCDLQDIASTRELFSKTKPDVVLHLASQVLGARSMDVLLSTYHSNLTSTINLLVAAQETGCRRVVLTGSLEEPDPSDEWSVPSSPYAAAKFAAMSYGRMFNALFDLPVVALRVFMVYGPGQADTTKLIPYVITSLNRQETPTFTSGTRLVDWIFVDDVVNAFVAAAVKQDIEGKTLEIGSGQLVSVREIVEELFAQMGVAQKPVFGSVQDRPMEQVKAAKVDYTREHLDWQSAVDLKTGLEKTISWYSSVS